MYYYVYIFQHGVKHHFSIAEFLPILRFNHDKASCLSVCAYFPGYSEYFQSVKHCKQRQCLSSRFSSSSSTIFLQVSALCFFIICNELLLSMDFGVYCSGQLQWFNNDGKSPDYFAAIIIKPIQSLCGSYSQ